MQTVASLRGPTFETGIFGAAAPGDGRIPLPVSRKNCLQYGLRDERASRAEAENEIAARFGSGMWFPALPQPCRREGQP